MLSGLDKLIIGQILLLLDYSLRLAPSCPLANAINRVAVTSPVLCTSITLNKGYCELFTLWP